MATLIAHLRLPDGRAFIVTQEVEPDSKQSPGEHPYSGTIYYWREGNLACDCNRMLYIERQYDTDLLPPEDNYRCGDTVELVSLIIDGEAV